MAVTFSPCQIIPLDNHKTKLLYNIRYPIIEINVNN